MKIFKSNKKTIITGSMLLQSISKIYENMKEKINNGQMPHETKFIFNIGKDKEYTCIISYDYKTAKENNEQMFRTKLANIIIINMIEKSTYHTIQEVQNGFIVGIVPIHSIREITVPQWILQI